MDLPIFVYGTLRDPDVLSLALGNTGQMTATPGVLSGYRAAQSRSGPFPVLIAEDGCASEGVLLGPPTPAQRDALISFEGDFDYVLVTVSVETKAGPVNAQVFISPRPDDAASLPDWRLKDWARDGKAIFIHMAREIVATGPTGVSAHILLGGLLRRAIASSRAERQPDPPFHLMSKLGREDVTRLTRARRFTGFFAMEELRLRHRLYGGGESEEMTREVFVTGDAVSVLPWDPVTDEVVLIEQIRSGLLARGDRHPWNLEVIAGLCDRDEPPETTARREAQEEARLQLGRMEVLGRYYTSPGSLTEYITSYVAEADLSGYRNGVHGIDTEHEDIRTILVPADEAIAAIDSGEARNAPLMISLYEFEKRRGDLRTRWATSG